MTNGNYDPGLTDPNKPPSLTVAPIHAAIAGEPVTLTASVTDDGLRSRGLHQSLDSRRLVRSAGRSIHRLAPRGQPASP